MRVAQGAAYPLITYLRQLGSVFLSGVGSTTAVALGTGLGVLRLGLGVVKFLVQLGVFASVLYTLLALDIDPVEQLLRLLPMSEVGELPMLLVHICYVDTLCRFAMHVCYVCALCMYIFRLTACLLTTVCAATSSTCMEVRSTCQSADGCCCRILLDRCSHVWMCCDADKTAKRSNEFQRCNS